MKNEEKLDRMITLIKDDCRFFGVAREWIDSLEKDVLIKGHQNDDYSFCFDDLKGYVLTFWERGYCNWGMASSDEAGFRFLFQRHIVLNDFQSVQDAERFMRAAFPVFGTTEGYKEAAAFLNRKMRKNTMICTEQTKMDLNREQRDPAAGRAGIPGGI